jgi:hypothetical protein
MDNFNFKQYLFENRSGMYSKAELNEHRFEDATALGGEIAKAHPELLKFKLNGDTKKYQDSIFKYAGELLHTAGVSLQTVRNLAYNYDWAHELVDTVGDEFEYGTLGEVNPADLGAAQDAADTHFDQEEDESYGNIMEAAYGNVGSVNKVAPAETGIGKYLDILHNHDWFYHFSDDTRAWTKGQADKGNLKALYNSLTPNEKQQAMDTFVDKYLSIHDPKQFPNAANNVKYLTTDTFKGAI